MTEFCHKHSSPMPLRSDDGAMRCRVCWVETTLFAARWWRSKRGVRPTFAARDLLADRGNREMWRGRDDEANATTPTQATSTALPHVEVGAAGTDALLMASWERMRSMYGDVAERGDTGDTGYNLWLTVQAAYASIRRDQSEMQAGRRATAAAILRAKRGPK